MRALDLSPVPLPDRVVWTLSTEGDLSFRSGTQGRIQESSVAHRFDPEAFSDCLDGCQ